MELKALVKVGLLLFLMGFTATVDATRFDQGSFITQVLPNNGDGNYYVKSTTTACCDKCICTKSQPPQCRCEDVRVNTCHSACKMCLCNRKYPPDCWCNDVNSFCYDKCSSVKAEGN